MRSPPRLCAAFPETPERVPRQPECTIPTSRSPTSATGTQSAMATERQRSVSEVTSASASPAKPGSETRTTPSPAIWRTHAVGLRPIALLITARFSSTALGSSPTFLETFSESYGGSEAPPRRVKKKTAASLGGGPVRCGVNLLETVDSPKDNLSANIERGTGANNIEEIKGSFKKED